MDQERQWVAAALQGDQQAFAQLVHAYQNPVYNLCFRMLGTASEAEDAAQETFVRVYVNLKTYDPLRKLSSWILTVASHHCIDRLRRKRLDLIPLEDLLPWQPLAPESASPEQVVVQKESRDQVHHLMQSLNVDDRLVVALRYWQDLSYVEIADITGTTESAVKSRLHRARSALARQLLGHSTDAGAAPLGRTEPAKGRRTDNALL